MIRPLIDVHPVTFPLACLIGFAVVILLWLVCRGIGVLFKPRRSWTRYPSRLEFDNRHTQNQFNRGNKP